LTSFIRGSFGRVSQKSYNSPKFHREDNKPSVTNIEEKKAESWTKYSYRRYINFLYVTIANRCL